MKTLLLLRHAKSSWGDPSARDFDRPLNKRGMKAAPLIGRYMRKRKVMPDVVISSLAVRARLTAELVVDAAGIDVEVRFDERIYEASTDQLMGVVSEIEERVSVVLLVGHNFGIEQFLERLTGEVHRMPTAALAQISLELEEWDEVRDRVGKLDWIVKPKELENR
ncbi:MAG TPA: histidine phosphatase family protein [Pyrinomonadaceae bacterium]|nr:histidine phosphatase family protein [Pyrinomonadaceae bacterium]